MAADILAELRKHVSEGDKPRLDLLVLTHEHWDHLSGFAHAHDLLLDGSPLEIGELWLAWTEKPDDLQAQALRQRFGRRRRELGDLGLGAVDQADPSRPLAASDAASAGVLGFLGPLPGLGAADALTTDRIIEEVRQRARQIRYLEPGQVLSTPGSTPLRTYVLGPPRDETRLFKDRPSQGPGRETYLNGEGHEALPANDKANIRALQRLAAAAAGTGGQAEAPAESSPFDQRYRSFTGAQVRAGTARHQDGPEQERLRWWLHQHYVAERAPCRYEGRKPPKGHKCQDDQLCRAHQADRRIDGDWVRAAESLALKLDSDTNNTSLVLAFELRNGEVLLFAADAQVGNWESWYDRTYAGPHGPVTVDDLLVRTTLYKVGHHGSHNATLSGKGLERMTDRRLVALLSTNEAVAMRQGVRGWRMPWPELKYALVRRTSGRLLRGDAPRGQDRDGTVLTQEPGFLARVTEDPGGLWVEYRAGGELAPGPGQEGP
ncbi:hypothetical protein [Rubellimicrobium arenae]|uniref:hypothetical protein n=1 Tax=Rubellimicrobium arenae TaxID=2817372 RepID=UPI001B30C6E5|nr:hypothetical protein [Rubellimicrobium arenae]